MFIRFKEKLADSAKKNTFAAIYLRLFSLLTDDQLEKELQYLYSLYNGTDDYWRENSKTEWFAIWHKSIRQTDYFSDCYQKK